MEQFEKYDFEINQSNLEENIFIEEQFELNEVAASLATISSGSSASCPSSVGTLTTASSWG